jgi:hypothetical protein
MKVSFYLDIPYSPSYLSVLGLKRKLKQLHPGLPGAEVAVMKHKSTIDLIFSNIQLSNNLLSLPDRSKQKGRSIYGKKSYDDGGSGV